VQTLIYPRSLSRDDESDLAVWPLSQDHERRLTNIEFLLQQLVHRTAVKAHYSVDEFSKLVGKAPFTVRQWCNEGRINAEKSMTQSGSTTRWVISQAEYERYSREGLLPLQKLNGKSH
jgi:hypothetical protein